MSIIVGSSVSLPTPQTYTGLQASIRNWLNRSDLDALIPDFIVLAEERINRALRVREMEVAMVETAITDNAVAAPVGTVAVKSLWVTGREDHPLKAQSFDFVKRRGTTGTPKFYAWQGESLVFDGTGSVAGVLYQRVPALSDASDQNWLLTASPSCYLFGALREAFDYVRNDAERDRWSARFEAVLADLNGTDMRDRFSGPLSISAPGVV